MCKYIFLNSETFHISMSLQWIIFISRNFANLGMSNFKEIFTSQKFNFHRFLNPLTISHPNFNQKKSLIFIRYLARFPSSHISRNLMILIDQNLTVLKPSGHFTTFPILIINLNFWRDFNYHFLCRKLIRIKSE